MGCGQKKKKHYDNVAVSPAPVRVPSQWPLAQMSRLSAKDKDDNDIIPGAVHRFPGIYIIAEDNARKTSAKRSTMKVVRQVIASNGIPYFQISL